VLNDFTESLDKFDSLKKQVMGQSGPGVDVNGTAIEIIVEKTDKFIQLDPSDGMPIYVKQDGSTYKIRDEE
jgi:predicted nucleotide-binding protein (sugar kinase/HSP70/actin superfamily)